MHNLPLSFDILMDWYCTTINDLKKIDHYKLNTYKLKHNWRNDIKSIIENHTYDALVLTNVKREVVWVSPGFQKMTGYDISYLKNKNARQLLQEGTTNNERANQRIKTEIAKGNIVTEVLVNKKKNGELYNCEITIIPLLNDKNKICHFLGVEREVA